MVKGQERTDLVRDAALQATHAEQVIVDVSHPIGFERVVIPRTENRRVRTLDQIHTVLGVEKGISLVLEGTLPARYRSAEIQT